MSLAGYEEVKDRLPRFWQDHEDGRILTELVEWRGDEFVVKASIYRPGEDVPAATGYAHERLGGQGANQNAALENCETSAIGRALANWKYASENAPRPSREEMAKATRGSTPSGGASSNECAECAQPIPVGAPIRSLGGGAYAHKECP